MNTFLGVLSPAVCKIKVDLSGQRRIKIYTRKIHYSHSWDAFFVQVFWKCHKYLKKSPTCFHFIFLAYSQYFNFTRKYTHTRKTPFFVPIATSLNSGSQAMAEGLCGKPCRTDWKIKHSYLTLMFIGNIVCILPQIDANLYRDKMT